GAGRLDDLADAVVALVAEEDVAAGVHGDAERVIELGGGGRPAVPAEAASAVAGDGDDHAGRFHHLADAVVVGVGDVEVAVGVHGPPVWAAEVRRGGRDVVAVVGGVAGAGDGDNVAGRLHHLPNAAVVGVGDVDVAAAVHGGGGGQVQHGGGAEAA